MRGKLKEKIFFIAMCGITPACAGKTVAGNPDERTAEDHPRVCGENDHAQESRSVKRGSPPRVRGKPNFRLRLKSGSRITPACAGKTTTAGTQSNGSQDHPRVCGENLPRFCPMRTNIGSPPRVRGKRSEMSRAFHVVGITPACAGKTATPYLFFKHNKDHPRVCGEN